MPPLFLLSTYPTRWCREQQECGCYHHGVLCRSGARDNVVDILWVSSRHEVLLERCGHVLGCMLMPVTGTY